MGKPLNTSLRLMLQIHADDPCERQGQDADVERREATDDHGDHQRTEDSQASVIRRKWEV